MDTYVLTELDILLMTPKEVFDKLTGLDCSKLDPKVMAFAFSRPGFREAVEDYEETVADSCLPVLCREASAWIRAGKQAGITFTRVKGSRDLVKGLDLDNCPYPISGYTVELRIRFRRTHAK